MLHISIEQLRNDNRHFHKDSWLHLYVWVTKATVRAVRGNRGQGQASVLVLTIMVRDTWG